MKEVALVCGKFLSGLNFIADTLCGTAQKSCCIYADTLPISSTNKFYEDSEMFNVIGIARTIQELKQYDNVTYCSIHHNRKQRIDFINEVSKHYNDARFVCIFVDSDLRSFEEGRAFLPFPVKDNVVYDVFNEFEKPIKAEGWNRIFYTEMDFERGSFRLAEQ